VVAIQSDLGAVSQLGQAVDNQLGLGVAYQSVLVGDNPSVQEAVNQLVPVVEKP